MSYKTTLLALIPLLLLSSPHTFSADDTGNYLAISTGSAPEQMYFIGGQLTGYNLGLDHLVSELVRHDARTATVEADRHLTTHSGLASMWEVGRVNQDIATSDIDIVVFAERVPLQDVDAFYRYARKYDHAVKQAGAKSVLLMSWPGFDQAGRFKDEGLSLDEIARAHQVIADELQLRVAPAGLAFEIAKQVRPALPLVSGHHKGLPSIHGSYLAASVVYSTITGLNPVGLTYRPIGITEDEALFLQEVAWEAVMAFPTPSVMSVEDAVARIWDKYEATVNSGDLEGWLSLWTEDGIRMPPNQLPSVGEQQLRRAVTPNFANEVKISIQSQEVEAFGEYAYARGMYQLTVTPADGSKPLEVDGKFMTVLKQQADGSWKIHRDIFNSNR